MDSCVTCKKTSPDVKLKRCAKCQSSSYCSRDCQKADWKVHKKVCGSNASANFKFPGQGSAPVDASTTLSPPKGLTQPIARPFTRLDNNTWLHDRPEVDVYRLLIDAHRMRQDDDYKFDGEVDDDSVYSGSGNGLDCFKRFLRKVASRPGLLPTWWSPEKQAECEKLGSRRSGWYDLSCAIEKADIIEHYGDSRFPMQLRMFCETVYGRGPGGSDGAGMRKMMMAMEGGGLGDMSVSMLDASGGRR